ncbi:MAG: hypothetical protein KKD36_08445 [Bacteroidetes bacterium]|nr:hypothetical protein [Bacteroidota bacterium]
MKSYLADEMCKNLMIANSTLRKYAQIFEGLGYSFLSGSQGRTYTEENLELLKLFLKEKEKNPKVKNSNIAARILDERYGIKENMGTDNISIEFPFAYFEESEKRIIEGLHVNAKLLKQLNIQVNYLSNSIANLEKMMEKSPCQKGQTFAPKKGIIRKLYKK